MSTEANLREMLHELARDQRLAAVHLPYSTEFEAICQKFDPNATSEVKHRIWELFLEIADKERAANGTQGDEEASAPVSLTQVPAPSFALDLPRTENGDKSRWLFPIHDAVDDGQPWTGPAELALSPEDNDRRQKMLAAIANSYLSNHEQRVAYILQKYPDTRDSDTALCIRYWKMFQADVLEKWTPFELEALFQLDRNETIGRVRRMIQNELRLFRGVKEIGQSRNALQRAFHEYIAAHRDAASEIRFYLDETGNEGDKTYIGIAGVCALNWKQFEKHHAGLQLWRARQAWPETIHFSDVSSANIDRSVALLRQLQSRRSGLLFLGYSLLSRGRTREDLFSLFIQLVVDALRFLIDRQYVTGNCNVRVIKEADLGFDNIYLHKLSKQLDEVVAVEFPGQLAMLPVEAFPKGRTVLLECADLIAGGMQRRALRKGQNPKDRLAEAVMNVTGFEDSHESGALFKLH